MKRRDFLSMTTLAAGAAALTPVTGVAQVPLPWHFRRLDTIEPVWIPLAEGVMTTEIGFGTGMRGGQRRTDLIRGGYPKAIEMLRYAYDLGIRHYDLADMYGTHDVVAEALRDKPRDSYVLTTKLWLHSGGLPEEERLPPERSVPRFIRELQLRGDNAYIDVVQIHCIMNDRWRREFETAMEGLARLKQQGVIRAQGISSHSNEATEQAAESDWCDVVNVCINPHGIRVPGTVEEAVRVTKKAYEAGKGVVAMKVVGEGRLPTVEERKASTKFVMDLKCTHSMTIGFTEMWHINEFVNNVNEIKAEG